MRDDPEANQQFSLLSNEELTSCSLLLPQLCWTVMGCDRLSSVPLVKVSLRPGLSLVVSVSQVYGYVLI